MNDPTPTFAIVGAVNHGKSSVTATLAEDDEVRISSRPGETLECAKFWLDDLFCFWDTPGFQDAREAYEELKTASDADKSPLHVFREFIERHRGQPDFDAECKLLQPIVDGAGIIYVVDGSKQLTEFHLAEMEILRLTGQPRLAIINRTGHDGFIRDWKQRLGSHFNAVREFNAHHATFSDRRELLDTLASIEQAWKPKLHHAVEKLTEQHEQRLDECAEIITELLKTALQYRLARSLDTNLEMRDIQRLQDELKQQFTNELRAMEAAAHRRIISHYRHNRVYVTAASHGEFIDTELFSAQTWKAFGLNAAQLAAAGASVGAAAGAATDLMTAGSTWLMGTLIGAGFGGFGGLIVGKQRPELQVKLPRPLKLLGWKDLAISGQEMSVGPYAAANFPWILLDRAIGTFFYVINRPRTPRRNRDQYA